MKTIFHRHILAASLTNGRGSWVQVVGQWCGCGCGCK